MKLGVNTTKDVATSNRPAANNGTNVVSAMTKTQIANAKQRNQIVTTSQSSNVISAKLNNQLVTIVLMFPARPNSLTTSVLCVSSTLMILLRKYTIVQIVICVEQVGKRIYSIVILVNVIWLCQLETLISVCKVSMKITVSCVWSSCSILGNKLLSCLSVCMSCINSVSTSTQLGNMAFPTVL